MMHPDAFREMALSLAETTEDAHFDKTAFKVRKKIFATLDASGYRACLKLSITDQDTFALADPTVVYAVPNLWGKKGWTYLELQKANPMLAAEALKAAYCEVAPKKLANQVVRA